MKRMRPIVYMMWALIGVTVAFSWEHVTRTLWGMLAYVPYLLTFVFERRRTAARRERART